MALFSKCSNNACLGAIQLLGLLLIAAAVSACAPLSTPKKKHILTECVLPEDQTMTFSGRWKSLPIPIAFSPDFNDPSEIADVVKAADTWNEFYKESLKVAKVLDYGDPNNPNRKSTPKPSSICDQGIILDNQYVDYVTLYKLGSWPYSHNAMALTSTCTEAQSSAPWPTKYMHMGVLEFNYEDFFVQGKRVPDLVSIATHELGHLLGLDHSCESEAARGFPNCSAVTQYLEAVLAPTFGFYGDGLGVQRRDLNDNDMGRGNCLYKDILGGS